MIHPELSHIERLRLFSQEVVGFAQSTISARWLQYYTIRMYDYCRDDVQLPSKVLSHRSFHFDTALWADSETTSTFDTRFRNIIDAVKSGEVGEKFLLSIFSGMLSGPLNFYCLPVKSDVMSGVSVTRKLRQAKDNKFAEMAFKNDNSAKNSMP